MPRIRNPCHIFKPFASLSDHSKKVWVKASVGAWWAKPHEHWIISRYCFSKTLPTVCIIWLHLPWSWQCVDATLHWSVSCSRILTNNHVYCLKWILQLTFSHVILASMLNVDQTSNRPGTYIMRVYIYKKLLALQHCNVQWVVPFTVVPTYGRSSLLELRVFTVPMFGSAPDWPSCCWTCGVPQMSPRGLTHNVQCKVSVANMP